MSPEIGIGTIFFDQKNWEYYVLNTEKMVVSIFTGKLVDKSVEYLEIREGGIFSLPQFLGTRARNTVNQTSPNY